ncbi:MAG TPA: nuclear transport factor 2 family protein [Mycobacteriales bacterium]|nr:nuclear transport factor 2 family protein [Mycobacteriales bacterium]
MLTSPNADLLTRFYTAFDARDGAAMAACYAPDAQFSDPVFVGLRGAEPGAMWTMLTSRSKDLRVELVDSTADETAGTAHWIARYTFTPTGRPVVNDVRSTFRFAEGLIVEQRDTFSFYTWSRQALGLPGLLLGWSPIIRRAVQRKARAGLSLSGQH